MKFDRALQRVVDAAALTTMVAGYAAFFWITRALWQVPRGSDIGRPMGMAVAMIMLGFLTPCAVMIVSNFAPEQSRLKHRRLPLSEISLAGSVCVLPLALVYMPFVCWLRGLRAGG